LQQRLTGRHHVILTFHRVLPPGIGPDPFDTCPSVSIDAFVRILDVVESGFHIVSLKDLVERRAETAPLAAVTFDDGWRDNYEAAFPVLRERRFPATIFVTVGKIGSCQPFWQQALGGLFRRAGEDPGGCVEVDLRRVLGTPDDAALGPELYRRTVAAWKTQLPATLSGRLQQAGWKPRPEAESSRCFISEAELQELADTNVDIGSHAVEHVPLTQQSAEATTRELAESKQRLEQVLGREVSTLSYPNGDHSNDVVQRARASGYTIACTTRRRRISCHDDPLRLPRVEPSCEIPGRVGEIDEYLFRWRLR